MIKGEPSYYRERKFGTEEKTKGTMVEEEGFSETCRVDELYIAWLPAPHLCKGPSFLERGRPVSGPSCSFFCSSIPGWAFIARREGIHTHSLLLASHPQLDGYGDLCLRNLSPRGLGKHKRALGSYS